MASARAAALTEGVIRAMFVSKLKLALGAVLALGLVGLGAGLVGEHLRAAPIPTDEGQVRAPAPQEPAAAQEKKAEARDATTDALRRMRSRNNLKQIGLAIVNYADTYGGKLPAPAIYDKSGKALLSWRVAILPFIEQDALYKQFKLDEPWDSEHNKKLLEQMPATYAPPPGSRDKDKERTYYQAIVGAGALWEPRVEKRYPASIPDGTSNTILVVEAATPVPWTKPEDLPFVPDQALPKFGGLFDGDFYAVFCDGGVQLLSHNADEQQLRYAIMPADGYPIDFDKITVKGGRGGKVDLNDLPRQNQQLKEAVETVTKEIAKERDELELLKAKVAAGTPKIDAQTAKLIKEHAELQKTLEAALEQLDTLRTERERLEQQLNPKKEEGKPSQRKP